MAREPLEKTLLLLRHIVDGSDAEGVGYSTYSTRSLFTYILLVRRHYGDDHMGHPWLKEHFNFLLATTLPGRAGSVGIADSSTTWFYGPEAQLYFLDRFVLRTGAANWLAQEIRKQRLERTINGELPDSDWPMLIHEFLWYAPHIGFHQPPSMNNGRLAMLPDWGVATYGGGSSAGSTFLSFKSSFLHGRGINRIANKKSYNWVKGWESFNSGHEHPDQGSFVFYPRGRPFITEAFYGPKYSYLNNVWLFGHSVPGVKMQCAGPFLLGQLGDCTRWLKWRGGGVGNTAGEVITADHQDGMVFISGEMSHAYVYWLNFQSLTRSLFLLNEDALVIIDNINLRTNSPVYRGNAFFNNLYSPFKIDEPAGEDEYSSSASINNGEHRIHWTADLDPVELSLIHPQTGSFTQSSIAEKRGGQNTSYYLNISVPLKIGGQTHVAWLLTSEKRESTSLKFLSSSPAGVDLLVSIGSDSYRISLVTDYRNLYKRYHWHYHGGLAQVQTRGETTRFGLQGRVRESVQTGPLHGLKRALPWTARTEVLAVFSAATLVIVIASLSMLRLVRCRRHTWVIITLLTNWFCLILLISIGSALNYMDNSKELSITASESNVVHPPSILITGLPEGGEDVLSNVFINHTDLHYLNVRLSGVLPPTVGRGLQRVLHACFWTTKQLASLSMTSAWLQSLYRKPATHFEHISDSHAQILTGNDKERRRMVGDIAKDLIGHRKTNPTLRLVLSDDIGSWMLKLKWLSSIMGEATAKAIIFVQDPRRWVANVLLKTTLLDSALASWGLLDQIRHVSESGFSSFCDIDDPCAINFLSVMRLVTIESQRPNPALHKLLASLWTAYTGAAICLSDKQFGKMSRNHFVRLEDFLAHPESVTANIYRFIGLPFTSPVRYQVRLVAQSGLDEFKKMLQPWQEETPSVLTVSTLAEIERICLVNMQKLGYMPHYLHQESTRKKIV